MTDDRATTSLRRMLLLTVSPVICVFAAGTAFAQSPARDYTQATAATGETGTVMLGEVVVAGSGGREESID
ncbi:MAG: TonB-dependent receptor, partial [Aurantimonas coralicida]